MTANEKGKLQALMPESGASTMRTKTRGLTGIPDLNEDLRRIDAIYQIFDGWDILALAYLVSRTTIACGADLENAIMRFADESSAASTRCWTPGGYWRG